MPKKATTPTETTQKPLVSENTILTLTIPAEQASKQYSRILAKHARQVKTEGFRKGKVPTKRAEELIGREALVDETLNSLLHEAYTKLIESSKKQPIGQPSFKLLSAEPNQDWKIEVSIAEKPVVVVKDYQKAVKAGHAAATKELKEAEKTKQDHDHSHHDHDHDHHHDEPDEESVRLHHIFRELVVQLQPAIPELLLRQETERQLRQITEQLQQIKMTLDDYLQRRQMTFEQLSTDLAVQSLGQLQLEFILLAIGEAAKLEVDQKEIESEIEANFPQDKEAAKNPYLVDHLKFNLLRKKITQHLLELK